MSDMTNEKALNILEKTYELALNGIPTSKAVVELAQDYKFKHVSPQLAAKALKKTK